MSPSGRVAFPNILESHKIPWFQTTNQVRHINPIRLEILTQNVPNHQSNFPISSPSAHDFGSRTSFCACVHGRHHQPQGTLKRFGPTLPGMGCDPINPTQKWVFLGSTDRETMVNDGKSWEWMYILGRSKVNGS